VGGVGISSSRLEAMSSRVGAQVLYLPSGQYLKVVSLGFPEILADLIYLWSIQYYGNYDKAERFSYLEHVYNGVIAELDPHYIDPYLVGALIMETEAGEHEMALRLLEKGMKSNPQEWILPFEAGFICFDALSDYGRAADYFERAMAIPSAPPAIRRIHAEMFNKMGDKRRSLENWKQIHDAADSEYVRDISWRHVHDLAIEVDLETLTAAIESYRSTHGRLPSSLDDLARAGLVAGIQPDPDGRPYVYDPATGSVKSGSPWRLFRKDDR
jgi:tetratricopeptide (TPR) repeat protein